MNKIRVIDLLNKIANGDKLTKKIVYRGIEYEYVDKWEQYVVSDNQLAIAERPLLETISRANYSCLNDEIEIIEEPKKIEKLNENTAYVSTENNIGVGSNWSLNEKIIVRKLNEIIDYINSKEKENE